MTEPGAFVSRHHLLVALARIGEGAAGAVMVILLPSPYDTCLMIIVLALIGAAIWYMRPRRCETCGRRPSLPYRKDRSIPFPRSRAWWDMRPLSISNFRWLCRDDIMKETHGYLLALRRIQPPRPRGPESPRGPGGPPDR